MKCSNCGSEMHADGNMLRCPNCGDQISGLERKYGKEPIIPPDEYERTRWDYH